MRGNVTIVDFSWLAFYIVGTVFGFALGWRKGTKMAIRQTIADLIEKGVIKVRSGTSGDELLTVEEIIADATSNSKKGP